MTDTTVQLGPFTFADFEVPEQIPFGGEQHLVTHDLVGGVRVIDVMGDTTRDLDWQGIFVGRNALDRALYLDGLRKAGQALKLTWSKLSFTVVIAAFECSFQRSYRLPYRIALRVASDDTSPVATALAQSTAQQMQEDTASVTTTTTDDPALAASLDTIGSAIAALGDLANLPAGAATTVLQPIAAARARVARLLAAADATIDSVATVGGVKPGVLPYAQEAALAEQQVAVAKSSSLLALDGTLARLAANTAALGDGGRSVVVSGTNLFALAANEFGDPMAWTALASANGLVDPAVVGIETLSIPRAPVAPTGILNG